MKIIYLTKFNPNSPNRDVIAASAPTTYESLDQVEQVKGTPAHSSKRTRIYNDGECYSDFVFQVPHKVEVSFL